MENDLISRSDLLKSPIRITGTLGGKYPFEAISVVAIENAPAVDAAPVVHGRWRADNGAAYCSVCAKPCHMKYDYCPLCGARMDGETK